MKCHYEVLGIPQNATDDDIKKAYKKLALKWHPDKNLDNIEEAKEQFLLVQQAFELLSDPHERAWYDKRRDEILIGRSKDGYVDDSIDLFQFFNPSVFKGFNDNEKGFYTVFRNAFEVITKEETEFSKDFVAPSFGRSDSSYDQVVQPFYSFWQSFVTKKSFCWLDPYDPKTAPNRAVLRMIEKENKKIRDKARKQRTEEVRALVAFVRKRDKRVQAQLKILREKAKESKKKMEEYRLKRIEEQNRVLQQYKESEWSKFSNMEGELKNVEASVASQFGDDSSSEGSESEQENACQSLYCSVCNKPFKSIKQFMNHEQSKQHKEKVKRFKICVKPSSAGTETENHRLRKEEVRSNRRKSEESDDSFPSDYVSEGEETDSDYSLEEDIQPPIYDKAQSVPKSKTSKEANESLKFEDTQNKQKSKSAPKETLKPSPPEKASKAGKSKPSFREETKSVPFVEETQNKSKSNSKPKESIVNEFQNQCHNFIKSIINNDKAKSADPNDKGTTKSKVRVFAEDFNGSYDETNWPFKHSQPERATLASTRRNAAATTADSSGNEISATTLESETAISDTSLTRDSCETDGQEILNVDYLAKRSTAGDSKTTRSKNRSSQDYTSNDEDSAKDDTSTSRRNSTVSFRDSVESIVFSVECDMTFRNKDSTGKTSAGKSARRKVVQNESHGSEEDLSSASSLNRLCKFCGSDDKCKARCTRCLNELKNKKVKQKELELIRDCDGKVSSDELLDCVTGRVHSLKLDSESFNSHNYSDIKEPARSNLSSFNSHNYSSTKEPASDEDSVSAELENKSIADSETKNETRSIKSTNIDEKKEKKKLSKKGAKGSEKSDKPLENHLEKILSELSSVGLSKKQRRRLEQQKCLMELLKKDDDDDFCGSKKKNAKKKSRAKKDFESSSDDSDDDLSSSKNKKGRNPKKSSVSKKAGNDSDEGSISTGNLKSSATESSVKLCDDDLFLETDLNHGAAEKTSLDNSSVSSLHYCLGCTAGFNSKNKLFDHLRKTNHAAPVTSQDVRNLKKTSKSKSKRKL